MAFCRACRRLTLLMQPDGLDDLFPNGMHRAERGHRFLEHEGDLGAANGAHILAVRVKLGQIDDLIGAPAVKEFAPPEEDLSLDNTAGAIDDAQDRPRRNTLATAALADDAQAFALDRGQSWRHQPL